MIKNVIFDMGGVLVEWDPSLFLQKFGLNDENDIQIVLNNTMGNKSWIDYDMGFLTYNELLQKCLKTTPSRLQKYTRLFVTKWHTVARPVEGMPEYFRYLQNKGYKIYLLSNAGKNQPFYFRKFGYKNFDGKCVSAYYGIGKPKKEFFEIFLNKFKLKPEECVFIDDREENIVAADKLGIKGILFENTNKLKKELQL